MVDRAKNLRKIHEDAENKPQSKWLKRVGDKKLSKIKEQEDLDKKDEEFYALL